MFVLLIDINMLDMDKSDLVRSCRHCSPIDYMRGIDRRAKKFSPLPANPPCVDVGATSRCGFTLFRFFREHDGYCIFSMHYLYYPIRFLLLLRSGVPLWSGEAWTF